MLTNQNGGGFIPPPKGIKMKEIKKKEEQPIKEIYVYLTKDNFPPNGNMTIPFNDKDEFDVTKGTVVKVEDGKFKLKASLENTIEYLVKRENFIIV